MHLVEDLKTYHDQLKVGGSAHADPRILTRDAALRIEEFERTLGDWRERFSLVEDGREFVSVPAEFYDALLRK